MSSNNTGIESLEVLQNEVKLLRAMLERADGQVSRLEARNEKLESKLEKAEEETRRWRDKYLELVESSRCQAVQPDKDEIRKLRDELADLKADKAKAQSRISSGSDGAGAFPEALKVPPEGMDLLPLAAGGDWTAALKLAGFLESGLGGVKNPADALLLYRWLAAQPMKDEQLLELLDRLEGSKEKEALCFELASRSGKSRGVALRLARCYRYGRGVEKNESEAARYYFQARDEKDVLALLELIKWFQERGSAEAVAAQLSLLGKLLGLSESQIIAPKHFAALVGWLPATRGFELLWRASQVTSAAFHQACDNHGPTLTLIKTQRSSIFGGYYAQAWRCAGGPLSAAGTFIFILESPKQKTPVRLEPKDEKHVWDRSDLGFFLAMVMTFA